MHNKTPDFVGGNSYISRFSTSFTTLSISTHVAAPWSHVCTSGSSGVELGDDDFLENDILGESEHKNLTESLQKMEESVTPLNINIEKMFNKRESNNLLLKCGESSYKYNKYLEESVFKIPSNFLSKQRINPYIRTKMIDWMIEVLSVFDASEETFFLSRYD